MKTTYRLPALAIVALLLTGCGTSASDYSGDRGSAAARAPSFGDRFWDSWGDGRAEVSSYDLLMPRYGEVRKGTAVAIFVTETFSNELRVKADPGKHPPSDEVPVMKLNLVEDFPTGIYDYNWMTSIFVALQQANGRPAGSPMKISFSGQEWCGHVYSQLLFDSSGIRHTAHSYFDGEADQRGGLDYPRDAIAEDALWFWARGFAGPLLQPGGSAEVNVLMSLKRARANHSRLAWTPATLSRAGQPEELTAPAGTFDVEKWTAAMESGLRRTFYVEADLPHRIVQWESNEGESAQLVATERLAYWKMNGPEYVSELERIGLTARPARTP